MTDLREKIARVIYGEHGGYPFEDPCAPSGLAFTKADQIIALLPQPAVPEGWVMVPREPTDKMLADGWSSANRFGPNDLGIVTDTTCAEVYRAMLAASPSPPADRDDDEGEVLAKPKSERRFTLLADPPSPPAETWDDAEADATDFAHPAWWRGHDHTSRVFCQIVTDILDGKDNGAGFNHEPWGTLRRRLLALAALPPPADPWQPIETAPREPDEQDLTLTILLGFAPDEEGHTLATREGWWRQTGNPGWVTSIDPNVARPYIQPTHWMPLPTPPKESDR